MAGISFHEVTKRFGDVVAVDDLTLDIEDRELLVLLGPSGCGKSTALRMIAGLDEPTSGTVSIGEEVVNGVDPGDRDIAMVFQSYALYPHMTVFKNIEAPLLSRHVSVDGGTPRRLDAAERRSRVVETAATLDLGDYLDRKPAALSGGQRQRVALARAIVRRPRVFLMDEPLSNLDAKLRTQTRLELVELWRRLETTFVYVTHDQVEAMTMASRIAILVEGRLQQVGRPQEVYQRPANLFVARFIGSPPMNTLDATVGQVGEGYVARVGDVALPLPPDVPVSADQRIVVGVRPEHLRIDADGPLDAVVRNVEMLGHEQHVICEVANQLLIVRASSDVPIVEVGTSMRLRPDPGQLHIFEAESGGRLA
ncbi:ABC transporter ATP-binding protein [Candidatus Neomicrothrix sp.]|jgi:multiple sugar transport system ATP-binding protein|uniref:ABC transporter ATP-binding protein n=1 Tax=Candidatus Neomicrothrix subdominans TaxID=2954438 RepID=A0A936N9B2_9ACTN|nr:ABC transporter ATP-binding protein [Candidatus Microthrix sp.]MBK9295471.1 ABC transporter ATP-binding protein [Candidatus Microthrix subdominans]MBK6311361.1 ABC transporter ATP-binding protein [Candidatus Microthrix sp.]MBK6438259.1 ABC transporter ATP-binding protein [Candidatus Microthrix sp.]MBK6970850.1 ABC transporter ATP-binding protein [Candidatus Microthrix sp.]MBK7165514.1 ABC transporter ATP-binding protein [Candidatus Microthrix sp.]